MREISNSAISRSRAYKAMRALLFGWATSTAQTFPHYAFCRAAACRRCGCMKAATCASPIVAGFPTGCSIRSKTARFHEACAQASGLERQIGHTSRRGGSVRPGRRLTAASRLDFVVAHKVLVKRLYTGNRARDATTAPKGKFGHETSHGVERRVEPAGRLESPAPVRDRLCRGRAGDRLRRAVA